MKTDNFITDDFLLYSQQAKDLYNNYSKDQPIIDYHNHLSPKEIAEDRRFDNITQVWIAGDHYKWRAMRTMGVDEKYITGEASDKEKFMAWARTVPHTLRNPLYHWTHLELKRYFGIEELLNEESAERIYDAVNEKLRQPEFSCRGLLKKMGVETVCTTEDPTDTLEYHRQLANDNFGIKVSTAFRPDKAVLIDSPAFNSYLDKLAEVADTSIDSFKELKSALRKRIEFFHENGCRLCDHGLNSVSFEDYTNEEIEAIFSKKRDGKELSELEADKYKTAILTFLSETYHELGWVQQFHLGALRNNNKRMLEKLGPDTGWDSIGDYSQAEKISQYLNHLDGKDKLTKTILYNLNPADNAVFASMIGNFNDGSIKGKVQFGSGWWFLDQKQGILDQLDALSNMGLVSVFIGMLTDSRSFLSFPRHEYFRRVLCNLFGEEMAKGELPDDMELVGQTIANISYKNAKEYFNF